MATAAEDTSVALENLMLLRSILIAASRGSRLRGRERSSLRGSRLRGTDRYLRGSRLTLYKHRSIGAYGEGNHDGQDETDQAHVWSID